MFKDDWENPFDSSGDWKNPFDSVDLGFGRNFFGDTVEPFMKVSDGNLPENESDMDLESEAEEWPDSGSNMGSVVSRKWLQGGIELSKNQLEALSDTSKSSKERGMKPWKMRKGKGITCF